MSNIKLDALADALRISVEKLLKEAEYDKYIDGNRITIVIRQGGAKLRIVEPLPKRPKTSRITLKQAEQVKETKKTFKDNMDVANLMVLLIRVGQEIDRIKFAGLDDEKLAIIKEKVFDMNAKFSQKLLPFIKNKEKV